MRYRMYRIMSPVIAGFLLALLLGLSPAGATISPNKAHEMRSATALGAAPSSVVYSTDYSTNTLYTIDSSTNSVVNTLVLPCAVTCDGQTGLNIIAVNAVAGKVYVADGNGSPGTVSVVDIASNKISAVIQTAPNIRGLAVNTNTGKVYVETNGGSSTDPSIGSGLLIIDGTTHNTLTFIPSNGQFIGGIAISSTDNYAYIWVGGAVWKIDGTTNQVVAKATILDNQNNTGYNVALDQQTGLLYMANGLGSVVVVDSKSLNTVTTINNISYAEGVAVNPATKRVYVTTLTNGVSVIDEQTNTVTATINAAVGGTGTIDIAVDTDANRVYVSLTPSSSNGSPNAGIVVIDGSTNAIITTIAAGAVPYGIAVGGSVVSGPAKLVFTQQPPATITVSKQFAAKVAVEDASGNPVATSGIAVQLSATNTSTGGAVTPTCTANPQTTNANGVATFRCSISQGGPYTLTASTTGLPSASSQPLVVLSKLVIFAPGIDLNQDGATEYDPYIRAYNTFSSIISNLDSSCPQPTTTVETLPLSPTGAIPVSPQFPTTQVAGPLVLCPNSGIAWLPLSYSGTMSNMVLSYFGDTTGQHLAKSADALDAVIKLGQRVLPGTIPTIIVGHSLGGAVAAYWGGENAHQSTVVVTLDSPVNGTWRNANVVASYCRNAATAIGLFTVWESFVTGVQLPCDFIQGIKALDPKTPVVSDLNAEENIQQMGRASALNIAYSLDTVVPSWYAINQKSRYGAIVEQPPTQGHRCEFGFNEFSIPPNLYHFCTLDNDAGKVAGIIKAGTPQQANQYRMSINLTVCSGQDKLAMEISARWLVRQGGLHAQTATKHVNANSCSTLIVPWTDMTVEVHSGASKEILVILPDHNQDVSLLCGELPSGQLSCQPK